MGAAPAPEVSAGVDLTEEAMLRLLRNGATALGHPLHDRYRQGWFNALGTLAGMLGNQRVRDAAYAMGDHDLPVGEVFAKAQELLGPCEDWPKTWPPAGDQAAS